MAQCAWAWTSRHLKVSKAVVRVFPCAPRQQATVWAMAWPRYGSSGIGRAARLARHGLCALGAWRSGSGGGRRCGEVGKGSTARVNRRTEAGLSVRYGSARAACVAPAS
jgi:hypothetical protein